MLGTLSRAERQDVKYRMLGILTVFIIQTLVNLATKSGAWKLTACWVQM